MRSRPDKGALFVDSFFLQIKLDRDFPVTDGPAGIAEQKIKLAEGALPELHLQIVGDQSGIRSVCQPVVDQGFKIVPQAAGGAGGDEFVQVMGSLVKFGQPGQACQQLFLAPGIFHQQLAVFGMCRVEQSR